MGGVQVGRGGLGKWGVGVSVQSMREMGKDSCSDFLQPFLENIDRIIAVTTEAGSLF